MKIYSYEEAFGAGDQTSRAMRQAIAQWFDLYYGTEGEENTDPCQRIAYTVVSKLVRTAFGEYQAEGSQPFTREIIKELNQIARQAVQLSLVGGECYLKPCPGKAGFFFTLIPRNQVLIFARDTAGNPTDVGTVERSIRGNHYYTLLERRTVDPEGFLTIQNIRIFHRKSVLPMIYRLHILRGSLSKRYNHSNPCSCHQIGALLTVPA